jgi:hypothetical protein
LGKLYRWPSHAIRPRWCNPASSGALNAAVKPQFLPVRSDATARETAVCTGRAVLHGKHYFYQDTYCRDLEQHTVCRQISAL